MTCYHPLIRIENKNVKRFAKDGHMYYGAKIVSADNLHFEKIKDTETVTYTPIPCRQCIGCRLDYSRQWANRGYLEAKNHDEIYFLTLTYSDDYITVEDEITTKRGIYFENPNDGTWNGTLVPEHFTKFVKNFRQILKRDYGQTGIKYMGCGEYGEKYARPHYHLIIFGAHLPLDTMYNARLIDHNYYYQNKIIERAWKYGISNVTEANWNTIAYVARYITKKINGEGSEELYASYGKRKEFFRVSQGIGKAYFEQNNKKIYEQDTILIKNNKGTQASKPPHYFDYLMKKRDEKHFESIRQRRKTRLKNEMKQKLKTTSKRHLDQLEVEETARKSKAEKLRRDFERNGII